MTGVCRVTYCFISIRLERVEGDERMTSKREDLAVASLEIETWFRN